MKNNTTTNPESQPQDPHLLNPFSQPLYPSISSPTHEQTHPSHQTPINNSTTQESQPHLTSISAPPPVLSSSSPKTQEDEFANPSSSSSHPPSNCNESSPDNAEKWGTHIMGHPAIPTSHPDNKNATLWGAAPDQAHVFHYPYVQYSPIEKSSSNNPLECILQIFNSWSNKAESMANNIWHNRKPSKPISSIYMFHL